MPLTVPALSPVVRGVIERPSFSFAALTRRPPADTTTELYCWTRRVFLEFRELELRLLAGGAEAVAAVFGLMISALERDQRAHRHAELPDLVGAAELRQVDDEAGREHLGAHAGCRSFTAPSAVPPVAIRSSTRITFSPFAIASSCISISSMPYSSE